MRLEFHPQALAEFEDSARYYADCRAGLEVQFIECVEQALTRVSDAPSRWAVFEGDVRRVLVRVFPFAIFYAVESDYVLVIAVMHLSREPGYLRHRCS
jgi:plasmid stabilization system protein ParE